MSKRKFDGNRAYKLAKTLVVGTTAIAGMYGLYALYMIESDSILNKWISYCKLHPDTKELASTVYSCMSTGLNQVGEISNLMYKSLTLAIVLPVIFFGGTALYNYLFPKNKG